MNRNWGLFVFNKERVGDRFFIGPCESESDAEELSRTCDSRLVQIGTPLEVEILRDKLLDMIRANDVN